MIRRVIPLIVFAFMLTACAALKATEPPIAATLPRVTETAEAASASPTETPFIDAQLTAIAETVHPQLTITANAIEPTLVINPPTPLPTSSFPATEPQLIYRAPLIRGEGFSQDGRWVSFWIPPPSNDEALVDAVPAFYEIATERSCILEDFGGFMAMEFPDTYSYWQPDGYSTLIVNGVPYAGLPCEEFVRAPDSFGPGLREVATLLSPDGKYEVTTVYKSFTVYPLEATSTITDVATGEVLNTVNWHSRSGQVIGWAGGHWIGSTMFLLTGTSDALLITVGNDHVANVVQEIFGTERASPDTWAIAYGSVQESTGNYHILIALPDENGSSERTLLYHSESGEVEALPYRYFTGGYYDGVYRGGFSLDGKWMLLQMPTDDPQDNYENTWLMPVDDRSREPIFMGSISALNWSGMTHRLAYTVDERGGANESVFVVTFPEMQIIARYTTEFKHLFVPDWSADGTRLLMSGSEAGEYDMGLFWAEP